MARQIYRDGHFFFEHFGAANGGKDAAIDVLEVSDSNFDKWYNRTENKPPEENQKDFEAELRKLLLR